MAAGNFRVVLLMAPDVGREPVPDGRKSGLGMAPIAPAWEDDLGIDRDPGAADMTASTALDIGRLAAEADTRRTGMSAAGAHGDRPAGIESGVQLVGGVAADVEVGHGSLRDDLGLCSVPRTPGEKRGNGERGNSRSRRHSRRDQLNFEEACGIGTASAISGRDFFQFEQDGRFVTGFRDNLWHVGHGRHLDLENSALMAIVNVTPDSFSDGGQFHAVEAAVSHALACVADGARIIDIGGESTRPGAEPVSAAEEQARVLPVIEALRGQTDALISVDTYRVETARRAVAAGAHIINDVFGLQREPDIAALAAETGAGLCIMHTGRDRQKLADVIEDQLLFLSRSLEIADAAGVRRGQIVLDPGFGFAKGADENLELMARFSELGCLELPFLVGTSRKRFVGELTGRDAADRDVGTAATTVLLRMQGATIFRVHNVAINRDTLAVADAMLAMQAKSGMKPS